MSRWMGIMMVAAGLWLGCNNSPQPAPDTDKAATPAQAAPAQDQTPAATEPAAADEGCPHAKKHEGAGVAKAGCDCAGDKGADTYHAGQGKGSCAGEGPCAGCDECKEGKPCDKADCPCKEGKSCDKADCGCAEQAGDGCPHTKKAAPGPEANARPICPYLQNPGRYDEQLIPAGHSSSLVRL